MARTKLFNVDDALENAMRLFWSKGYEATSMADLVSEMGINRASLYDTFGDKQALFIAAIEAYLDRVNSARLTKLRNHGDGRAAITEFFEELVAFSVGEGKKLGCLITNSVIERAPHDRDIAALLEGSLQRVEDGFYDAIQSAQRGGTIDATVDPRASARFLVALVQGLRVLSRTNSDERKLRDVITVALSTLPPPSVSADTKM